MIRHISLFFIKEEKKNEKESLKNALEACTKKVGQTLMSLGKIIWNVPYGICKECRNLEILYRSSISRMKRMQVNIRIIRHIWS